jgi:hypothetical protein
MPTCPKVLLLLYKPFAQRSQSLPNPALLPVPGLEATHIRGMDRITSLIVNVLL